MNVILRIAWRNLWRNPRRTWLTTLTIALGQALLLVFLGLGDGSHRQMIESAVRTGSGHVLFQRQGYQQSGELKLSLSGDHLKQIQDWLRAQDWVEIEHIVPRSFSSALVSSADGATGAQIMGVDPTLEKPASRLSGKLVEGSFLEAGDRNQLVMGIGVARKLKVDLGDKVVLMGQARDSSEIQSRLMRVKGIFSTLQEEIDHSLAMAPLADWREFLHLGKGVHQVAVLLAEEGDSETLAARGRRELSSQIEVLPWSEAMPELVNFIRVDDGGNYVFHVFLFLLIGFMALNTLLMSVLERQREFSLLDALGLTAAGRFAMVMLEASLIAALASVVGLTLGYSIHLLLAVYGLPLDLFGVDFEGASAVGVAFDPILYSHLSNRRLVQSILVIFLMTLLLAFWPALRAARRGNVKLLGTDR